jgi:hypothetical protein
LPKRPRFYVYFLIYRIFEIEPFKGIFLNLSMLILKNNFGSLLFSNFIKPNLALVYIMSSFGVDTLGGLTEKLKQLITDTQNQYETLIDSTQRYKQGKMNDKEYFSNIGKYLIASSAMNFLAIKVILEIKSAMDKGSSIKSPTGGIAEPHSNISSPGSFGIEGFVGGGGGSVGSIENNSLQGNDNQQQSSSLIEPSLKPVDIELEKSSHDIINSSTAHSLNDRKTFKNCIVCGVSIPTKAKFCSKCGNSQ